MKTVHGCLVQWMGRGILLVGEGGVGKTTCALEIVRRGGAWVADDLVEIAFGDDGLPLGRAHERIRGLAWLPSRGVFAVARDFPSFHAIPACRIDFVVELIKKLEKSPEKDLNAPEARKYLGLKIVFMSVMVDDDVQCTVPRIIRRLRRAVADKGG